MYLTAETDFGLNMLRNGPVNDSLVVKQFKIEKKYEHDIQKNLHAKVEALDFAEAKHSAKVIDDFISKTTEGKIRNMVNEQSVQGASSLIVNAIYFTAKWEVEFAKRSSSNGTFYSATGSERKVEYLNAHDVERLYAEDSDLQLLSFVIGTLLSLSTSFYRKRSLVSTPFVRCLQEKGFRSCFLSWNTPRLRYHHLHQEFLNVL
ncbi:hypothetical protein COOONC_05036 [Cooperia oncophora]